jgi:hypothetical protein
VSAWADRSAQEQQWESELDAQNTSIALEIAARDLAKTERITAAKLAARKTREAFDVSRAALQKLDEIRAKHRVDLDSLRLRGPALAVKLASLNLEAAHTDIPVLEAGMKVLAQRMGATCDEDVHRLTDSMNRLTAQQRIVEDDLAKAKGALEHVGGSVVRERISELDGALTVLRRRERDLDVEYDAWKLLVKTLHASEKAQGQHLGRSLAGPVSRRLKELTDGRYGDFELGTHLQAESLQVAGDSRELASLSAGTQDQLATLLRLCIAEQLQTSIVLDDHLSQSDAGRIARFNDILRTAATTIQVLFITCRPTELLNGSEFPLDGEASRSVAAGLVRAIDLTKIIERYPVAHSG